MSGDFEPRREVIRCPNCDADMYIMDPRYWCPICGTIRDGLSTSHFVPELAKANKDSSSA